jgi:hypothetical protein
MLFADITDKGRAAIELLYRGVHAAHHAISAAPCPDHHLRYAAMVLTLPGHRLSDQL